MRVAHALDVPAPRGRALKRNDSLSRSVRLQDSACSHTGTNTRNGENPHVQIVGCFESVQKLLAHVAGVRSQEGPNSKRDEKNVAPHRRETGVIFFWGGGGAHPHTPQ